ncbi:methyltransferase domain-containing protein [Paraglaciecola sp.]|uniref:methyltransferase domain-containing protein n=1 Tax=Paraglaciecola sp. TaxID=1920173 RepID=UPI00273FD4C2|nr:methyltransferase domain-containing protein [Paraglaciecola sp.]MDP5030831.1 methyltransferase domain-containing protein [Paraglaciecola sp.]
MSQSILVNHNKARIAKQFSRAAVTYDKLAKVQLDIALDAKAMLPEHSHCLLDIGCGTGRITQALRQQSQQLLAMDLAFGMLRHASFQTMEPSEAPILWLQGDAEQLPLQTCSVDTIFSSMALQWCAHPEQVLSEIHRVLVPTGHAVIALMTAGSFSELSQSWQYVDSQRHINEFYPTDTWVQAALKSGLKVDIKKQCYQTWHPDIRHLLTSIKGVGANILLNTSDKQSQNPAINRHKFNTLEHFYFLHFGAEQQLPLSYQILFLKCEK